MRRSTCTIAVALLGIGALIAILTLILSLRERLYREHVAAAEASLTAVGAILTRAHGLGVPFGQMVGVEDLLRSRATARRGIVAVRVLDAGGRIVWRDDRGVVPSTRVLEVPLGTAGRLQAEFVAPSDAVLLLRVAAVLLVIAAVLALPLLELARFADLVEEDFPRRYFRRQLDRVRHHDMRLTWRLAGARGDVCLRFLRDQVILLNEQYQRAACLVRSLQRTEPDLGRRASMGVLLGEFHRRFRFAAGGPIDRPVWPGEGTARCFATLALLLANLSVGGGGNAPYSPAAAPYSAPIALALWSAGLLAGTAMTGMRWPARLRAGLAMTVVANLLMIVSAEWSNLCAHVVGGLATALAASAAMDAARGDLRRTAVALLVAGTVVGPVLGLAATAALSPFGHVGWLYGSAASLALMTGVWFSYRLPDGMEVGGIVRAARIGLGLEPVLAGIAWSAALMAFIVQVSANREEALRLVILQLPGLYVLARKRAGLHHLLAVALALVCGAWLLSLVGPALLPAVRPNLSAAAGAVCLGGTLAVLHDYRGAPGRMMSGFAAGALGMLVAVAVAGRIAPHGTLKLELGAMLVAVSIGLTRSRGAMSEPA